MLQSDTDTLIARAERLIKAGDLVQAEMLLQESCHTHPDNADGWKMLGGVQLSLGRPAPAVASLRKAITLRPAALDIWMDLGDALRAQRQWAEALHCCQEILRRQPAEPNSLMLEGRIHLEKGDPEKAAECFRNLAATNPDLAIAHYGMAAAAATMGKLDDAVTGFQRALELGMRNGDVYYNLGLAQHKLRRFDDAVTNMRQAVALNPHRNYAHYILALSLVALGDSAAAVECYQNMLQINPNDPIAPYLMAAAKGDGAAPSASPREYVVELFDRYADRFESSLVGELEYRIPQHIQAAINALHHDTKPLEILDLGCGTGLCGRLLRDRASRLVGVDLSKNMVEKTRATGIYDEVRQAELTETLQQARESWDLIVAADVFVYVGELSTVFETCRAALRPGGLFAFSVEAAESDNGWKLRESARYAHSLDYIRGLAQRHAMAEKYLEHVAVRKEHNANIAGMVFVLEKPTS